MAQPHEDQGYSVERCKSGIGASTALQTVRGMSRTYEARERYWRIQLGFAMRREGVVVDGRDPDPTKMGVFQNHNCWRCHDGELPCVNGNNPWGCENLHARND